MISLPKSIKRLAAGGAVAALLAAGAVTVTSAPASAHGGMIYPADRVYQCYLDGYAGGLAIGQGGNMVPNNPACVTAFANGSYSFYTWYGNLLPQVAGRHEETIADGKLCGPSAQFAPYNAVSTHWPKTSMTSGQSLELRYAAKAQHPGWWFTYITKEGWDSSKPLAWSDLELIDETLNPPIVTGGPEGPEYRWTVDLPARSGDHIIYEVWERTDSPEAFYNCSDVSFSGGSAPTPTETSPEPTPTETTSEPTPTETSPEPTPTETTPEPTPTETTPTSTPTETTPEPTPTTTPGAPAACSAAFTYYSWTGGFTAEASIGNSTMNNINGWNVEVEWGNGEVVTQSWNANKTQTGAKTTFTNVDWNASIGHHGNTNFGFLGTGAPQKPASVSLNGQPCDVF